jgi:hypothetical protein
MAPSEYGVTLAVARICYTASCSVSGRVALSSIVGASAAIDDGIISKEQLMARVPNDDYDGAWKAALGVYLQEFLALCFPAIHGAIDWTRSYRFLETELQPATISRDAARPTSWLRSGGVMASPPGC